MKLDLQSVLSGAEAIYLQFIQSKELPLRVQQVLGLYIPSSSEENSPDSQASETQRLISQPQAGAASCNTAHCPTYP